MTVLTNKWPAAHHCSTITDTEHPLYTKPSSLPAGMMSSADIYITWPVYSIHRLTCQTVNN